MFSSSSKTTRKHKSAKGFTLIEILIVIALMAFLAIAGLTSTINSQKQYAFMGMFKEVMAKIREPRMYAVTNTTVPDEYFSLGISDKNGKPLPYIPHAFGVHITRGTSDEYVITVFADHEGNENEGQFDDGERHDYLMGSSYKIDARKYGIKVYDSSTLKTSTPDNDQGEDIEFVDTGSDYLTLFYKPPFGGFGTDVDGFTNIENNEAVYLKLYHIRDQRIYRYIAIFESGIAEAFYEAALTEIVPQPTDE